MFETYNSLALYWERRESPSMIYSDGGHQALSSSLILAGHADTRPSSLATTQTNQQTRPLRQDISVDIFYLCVDVGVIYLPLL